MILAAVAEAEALYIPLPAEEAMVAAAEVFKTEKTKLANGMSLLEASRLLYL